MAIVETVIHASVPPPFNIGGGNPPVINAETYGGTIPYQPNPMNPTEPIRLNVGDTFIVRLINDLPYPTGIHWHGIELENYSDGTEVTQNEVMGGPIPNNIPTGGTFLYKFNVPRPGIFWFHPHHHHSTNRVFRGQYGMIVVSESAVETALMAPMGPLPTTANTHWLSLSDITVCKAVNDTATYVDPATIMPATDRPEWLSNASGQNGPTPVQLCEAPTALNDMGHDVGVGGMGFAAGEIPNTFRHMGIPPMAGMPPIPLTVEGQTVLTNGVNVGGRKGTPLNLPGPPPGALDPGYLQIDAQPGDGLRFQIANLATTRYFRLILTTAAGAKINLIKVGGEGGILNDAVLEGGPMGTYDTKYTPGEILLPPGSRADVVAVIPLGTNNTTCTMWTRDFQRVGPVNPGGWAQLPTVPVLHIDVGNAPVPLFSFPPGTALKSSLPPLPPLVPNEQLGPATNLMNPFLNPVPPGKPGMAAGTIRLTAGGGSNGIDNVTGSFDLMPFWTNPHIGSTRYANAGDILQFRVRNESSAHHPFHLHGFSFHPLTLEDNGGSLLFTWPTNATEYRDNFDIPAGHTVTFKVEISPRPLADGMTAGGALGRWLFHCHIFFHAHHGMIGELVITDPDGSGSEKPNITVDGSWAFAPSGMTTTRRGSFNHPDGDPITLSCSMGAAPTDIGGGRWQWTSPAGLGDGTYYVYFQAEDPSLRRDQAVLRLKIGGMDDGSDNGDPHIHTVDGHNYDFQAVGEFIMLRDREGMEIQTRQTPVPTAGVITDHNTGLTSCVSLNTAVAARVGSHRIAYQPGAEGRGLQLYVDGKPARLTEAGIDLDGHRVSAFHVGGATGLRVDYEHHAVLTVTPHFWGSHSMWYMDVSVAHTQGDEGLMGSIPDGTWLPRLPTGATVGPMPQGLPERYVTLYRTFANAWRVTDASSLFVYAPGTSTATFTDEDWPAEEPPCKLKPQFGVPGPVLPGIAVEKAEQICKAVTLDNLHADCVFDVATTGDESFAKGYLIAQELKLRGTAVQVVGDKAGTNAGEALGLTATVTPIQNGRPTPTGSVTFLVDGQAVGSPVTLDGNGRASLTTSDLTEGERRIRAAYASEGGEDSYHPSSSPNLIHVVTGSTDLGANQGCWTWLAKWWWVLLILVLLVAALIWLL